MCAIFRFSVFMMLCNFVQNSSFHECKKMNKIGLNMKEILTKKIIHEKVAQLRRKADQILKHEPYHVRMKVMGRLGIFVNKSFNTSFPNSNSFDAFENPVKTEIYMLKDYLPINLGLGALAKFIDSKTGTKTASFIYKFHRKAQNTAAEIMTKLGFPFSIFGALFNFGAPTNADVIKQINKGLNTISKQMQTGFKDLSMQMQHGFKGLSKQMQSGFQGIGSLMINMTDVQVKLIDKGFRSINQSLNDIRKDIHKLEASFEIKVFKVIQNAHADNRFFFPVESTAEDYALMLYFLKRNDKFSYEQHRERFMETCKPNSAHNQETAFRYIKRQIFSRRMLETIIRAGHSEEAGVRDATRFGLSVAKIAILGTQNQIQCFGFNKNSLQRKAGCEFTERILLDRKKFIKKLLAKIAIMNIHSLPWSGQLTTAYDRRQSKTDLADVLDIWNDGRARKHRRTQVTAMCAYNVTASLYYYDNNLRRLNSYLIKRLMYKRVLTVGFMQGSKRYPVDNAFASVKAGWKKFESNKGFGIQKEIFSCLLAPSINGIKPTLRFINSRGRTPGWFKGYKNVLIPYVKDPNRPTDFTPCIKKHWTCCDMATATFAIGKMGIVIGTDNCCRAGMSGPTKDIYILKRCDISSKTDRMYDWLYFKYDT